MPKVIAVLIAAAALAAMVLAPSAGAAPKTCTASSPNVVGETVKGTLTSRDVNSVQARFATCKHAKTVIRKITSLRVEEPKSVGGFYCLPTVLKTRPDVVKYVCTFKGADTAMFVKLTFQVKYNLD
jgi:hypothetical protein